jgi:hypothetical protein
MYICETCREQVRPKSEPGIVFAVELKEVTGFNPSGSREFAEGHGVFFHEGCFPNWPERYRRKPMPPEIDDGGD